MSLASISRSRVGIGSPCGSCVGSPSLAAISRSSSRADDVLERLGLVVDAIPGHAEMLGEEQLEQPVVAQHLERQALARGRQRDALVGHVIDEPDLREALDHPRADAGRDAEPGGDVAVATGSPPARACSE